MSLSPRARKTRDTLNDFKKDLFAATRGLVASKDDIHCDLDNPTNNSPPYSPVNASSPRSPNQRKMQISPRVAVKERVNDLNINSPKSPLALSQTMRSQSTRSTFQSESFTQESGFNLTSTSVGSANTVSETEVNLLQSNLEDTKQELASIKQKHKELLEDYQHQTQVMEKMKEASNIDEKKYDDLKNEYQKLNYKTKKMKDELDFSENERNALKEKLVNKATTIAQDQTEICNLKETLDQKVEEISSNISIIKKLREEKDDLEGHCQKYRSEIEDHRIKIGRMEGDKIAQYKESDLRMKTLTSELEALTNDNHALIEEKARLEQNLLLKDNLSLSNSEDQEKLKETIKEQLAFLDENKRKIDEMSIANQTLREALEKEKHERMEAKKEHDMLSKEVIILTETLDNKGQLFLKLEADRDHKIEAVKTLEEKLQHEEHITNELKIEKNDLRIKIEQKDAEILANESLQEEFLRSKSDVKAKEECIRNLERQCTTFKEELSLLDKAGREKSIEIDSLNNEINDLKDKLDKIDLDRMKIKQDFESDVGKLSDKLMNKDETLNQIKSNYEKDIQNLRTNSQNQIKELQEEEESLQKLVKSKNNDIESLKRKIQQIESESNTLHEQIKICKDLFESERSTWSEKQEKLLKEIQIYENECKDKNAEKSVIKNENDDLLKKLEQSQSRLKAVSEREIELMRQNENLERTVSQTQNELKKLNSRKSNNIQKEEQINGNLSVASNIDHDIFSRNIESSKEGRASTSSQYELDSSKRSEIKTVEFSSSVCFQVFASSGWVLLIFCILIWYSQHTSPFTEKPEVYPIY